MKSVNRYWKCKEFRFIWNILKGLLVLFWMTALCVLTDSLKSIYIICGIVGVFSSLCSCRQDIYMETWQKWIVRFSGLLFGLMVCLANYKGIQSWILGVILWYCGGVTGETILELLYYLLTKEGKGRGETRCKNKSWQVFGISMVIICIIDLLYLLLFRYPGCMNSDGIIQVTNGLYDIRANHFPYIHTLMILLCIKIGYALSCNLNLGIAIYCFLQIIFMAFCFAYSIKTLYEAGKSKIVVGIIGMIYTFMPYHVAYGAMVWKDVLFGGAVLLFITALYRAMEGMKTFQIGNYICLAIGECGAALLRNNGWYAICMTTLIIYILCRKKMHMEKIVITSVLFAVWLLTHPIYEMWEVEPSEITESLSVPIQQVARVICENGVISEDEKKELDKLIDVEKVSELYEPGWSDPVKFSIDYHELSENKEKYLKIWVDIGINNPLIYLKAWIDQTKGYWNGGYSFWIWYTDIDPNWFKGYGTIEQTVVFERGAAIVNKVMDMFMRLPVFDCFRSIGLWVWMVTAVLIVSILKRDLTGIMITIPILAIVATLIIATPVYCEFRYAYSVFTCFPFALGAILRKKVA